MTDDAIDLSAILPADTSVLEILKPGGTEGTGWRITFAGPGHPKTVAWTTEQSRRNLRKEAQRDAQRENGRKIKPDDRDPDDVRRENVGWVVSRIIDWTPVKLGGPPIAFSEAAAMDLLMKPEMGWAYVQMVDFLADERSFTRRSATG